MVGVYLALGAVGVSTALLRVPWLWKKDSQRNVADSIARTLRQTAGDTFLQFFLSVYFPPKREQWIPQLQNTKLGRPHLPPSPSTSSARKIVLAHSKTCSSLLCSCHLWCNSPCSTAPSAIQSTHFWVHEWMGLLSVLVCAAEGLFFGYGCLISCKWKGKEKRNNLCCHDADLTLVLLFYYL